MIEVNRHMYHFFCLALAGLFIIMGTTRADDRNEPEDSAATAVAITTPQQAVQRAYQYTGFEEIRQVSDEVAAEMATMFVIENDSTPFLWKEVNGRTAWRVLLRDIVLELDRTSSEDEADNPMDFEVLLDSATGRILKVETVYDGADDVSIAEPTASEATDMIARIGERYHGFPTEPPAVSFLQALNKCKFYPLLARKIEALYVLHTHSRCAVPSPVWVISMRGLPPFSPSGLAPDFASSSRRTIVDARAGYVIYSTNIPYSLPKVDSAETK